MNNPFAIIFGGLFVSALLLSLAVTPLAAKLAARLGLIDNPGGRKIHSNSIPYGGGIAIFISVAAVVTIALGSAYCLRFFADSHNTTQQQVSMENNTPSIETSTQFYTEITAAVLPYLDGMFSHKATVPFGTIIFGGIMMFALGLIDDWRMLSPKVKLLMQIVAAIIVIGGGTRISLFIDNDWIGGILTVLWIVGITNSFNLLDNMDGLSAGVAFIAASLFFVVTLQMEQIFVPAFLAVFAGSLLGFLRYNFAPARLFMGDAGSLFIGFILSCMAVRGTFYSGSGNAAIAFAPLLVFGVPLFDTASVMWIRWRQNKPLFLGDTNHFSHRLVRLGMTRREAVLTIYLLGLILGGTALLLRQLDTTGSTIIFLIGLGIILLIMLLENAAARRSEG